MFSTPQCAAPVRNSSVQSLDREILCMTVRLQLLEQADYRYHQRAEREQGREGFCRRQAPRAAET